MNIGFDLGNDLDLKFPHSAIVSGPRSPALEERMRAAVGAALASALQAPIYSVACLLIIIELNTSDTECYISVYLYLYCR